MGSRMSRPSVVFDEPLPAEARDFYPQQVRQLYSLLPVAVIATAGNSVVVVAALWSHLPHSSLLVWLAGLLTVSALRSVLIRIYTQADEARKAGRLWGRLLIAGNLLSGLFWGSLPVFLFPDSMPHQVFEAFVIGGMVAGAVSTHSNLRLAFVAFALPASVPVPVRFFSFSDGLHLAMGFMCIVFIVLMFISSFRIHRAYCAVLQLNVENQSLIRRLREKSTKAEQITEELRNLTAYLDDVREEESKRIASEIHDQLGQSLTAAKIALGRLRNSWSEAPQEVRTGIQTLSDLLGTVINDVRRISRHLRPLVLDELGLEAAVEWLVDDFRERTGVACDLEQQVSADRLPSDVSMALFRVLQEALTNVARHAEARHVRIILIEGDDEIFMRVEDDGKGIPADYLRPHTFGVLSMKERALRLRGQLLISVVEPSGTVVTLRVPNDGRNVTPSQDGK